MASSHDNGAIPPQFILTPQQQNLLFRALTSNQPSVNPSSTVGNDPLSMSPTSLQNSSPAGQSLVTPNAFQESPFLDYDYDIGHDNNFDFDFIGDQAKMIGDLPGTNTAATSKDNETKSGSSEPETSDKRSHPDDDEDADAEEGGGKRRESESKTQKKAGRKPLTNEPTSKRKAQNRAAQRAFRERKEKHLQDLETKVEELEKASNTANSENAQLKAQIDKLTVELAEYKKRLTQANTSGRSVSAGNARTGFGTPAVQNLSDVNFHFEFPKFGGVQSSPDLTAASQKAPTGRTYPSPSISTGTQNSPAASSKDYASPSHPKSRSSSDALAKDASFRSSPGFNNSPLYDNLFGTNASRTSLDSASFSLNGGNTASPSASSNSNGGPSSSCGTSPEPCTQSPLGFKPLDTLTTIGEEQPTLTTSNLNTFGNIDTSDFNLGWLSQQNGGQFDPQLFNDYREPQENVLANTAFDDSFFNDAFDMDFTTPYNIAPSPNLPKKKNLIAEIDARKEFEDTITVTGSNNEKLLTCSNIWYDLDAGSSLDLGAQTDKLDREKLQTCPKVQNGDLDLDGLCSDLQKKAKCGGSGAVVDEHDFKTIMTKYLGPEDAKACQ
ncbi:transcription factor PAP1-domain-containing protein [Microdochium trichocladiopsis]|uniref:Transcription factor PAP1-domain-containing protein n=1 Tax=Microdochium trichocladiopsis TaxID=1682393 RepID=A0A9P9BVH9_9PEZI|nr:transcription factor PAP1-domain-containing protein [Microdochium trichocladiopsis]KAH7040288.1 transcription factor PAP1-domain-containing protein [Microdochium trichocladiopsis]